MTYALQSPHADGTSAVILDHTGFLHAATAHRKRARGAVRSPLRHEDIDFSEASPDWVPLVGGFLALRMYSMWCIDPDFARDVHQEKHKYATAALHFLERGMLQDMPAGPPSSQTTPGNPLLVGVASLQQTISILAASSSSDPTVAADPLMRYASLLHDTSQTTAPAYRAPNMHRKLASLAVHIYRFLAHVVDPERRPPLLRPLRLGISRTRLSTIYLEWGLALAAEGREPDRALLVIRDAIVNAEHDANTALLTQCRQAETRLQRQRRISRRRQ